jgi:23S rRNA (cytidine1920-2'-O)/16S rRNA (cytidine1409-2'-O)-methyltransferase
MPGPSRDSSGGHPSRERLDLLLVARGLAPNRGRAQALILAGRVRSGQTRLDKPGVRLADDTELTVLEGPRYVSRSGHKLSGALTEFSIDAVDRDALDVGASTGGFTQVLLEAGARRVIALDVGRGQLDFGLRNDPRVHVAEGKNARYLTPEELPFVPTLAVVDVSFISLLKVVPAVVRSIAAEGEIVALVKPQFEVGRGKVGRGGIVRDAALHREVLSTLTVRSGELGWGPQGVCRAALRGATGNQEFFLHLRPGQAGLTAAGLSRMVDDATEEESGT